jgi:hypothetical protein
MKMSVAPGRTEIVQSPQDVLGLPILVGVVLLAVVVRQLTPPGPNAVVLAVCAVAAVLDGVLVAYLLRRARATFVVTPDEITFTRWLGTGNGKGSTFTLDRTPGSKLRFRLQSNGFTGGQIQYLLKLRDDATGKEVPATSFGRRPVRRACESQGWTFS